jgi:NAD(P)-dependent dehydrogenase (short-subunit alcohol dehydrogenase family)
MKYMITGGNRGLGLELCTAYQGDSYSRANGYDITKDREKLAELSLNYDVFINNAFDGPFQETWADFGQVKLLFEVASLWQKNNKAGYIINIGSSGSESIVAPEPSWETYRVNKVALKHHSLQWTQAFKQNQTLFRTSLITVDRLDTELSRSRATWTGNGVNLSDVKTMIDLCIGLNPNSCIGEVTAWVNLDYK